MLHHLHFVCNEIWIRATYNSHNTHTHTYAYVYNCICTYVLLYFHYTCHIAALLLNIKFLQKCADFFSHTDTHMHTHLGTQIVFLSLCATCVLHTCVFAAIVLHVCTDCFAFLLTCLSCERGRSHSAADGAAQWICIFAENCTCAVVWSRGAKRSLNVVVVVVFIASLIFIGIRYCLFVTLQLPLSLISASFCVFCCCFDISMRVLLFASNFDVSMWVPVLF